MCIRLLVNTLVLICGASFAASAIAATPTERLAKDIQLQAFFHATHPWQVKIYEPAEPDADTGNEPVRVCLIGELGNPKPYTVCTELFGGAPVDGRAFPMQTFRDASLEMLSGPDGMQRPALIVRATFSGGGSGWLQGIYVWDYERRLGIFRKVFQSVATGAGQQEFLKKGPLAGAFVHVDQVYEGDEANMMSPVRYRMTVYEPVPLGYEEVLSLLSEERYASNHTGDGLPDAIATLTPIMSRALQAVYPDGVSALEQ